MSAPRRSALARAPSNRRSGRCDGRYAISCAHKAGCAVFASWQDIVEVQPRMMLCLIAAIMAVDMQRSNLSAKVLLEQLHGDTVVATGANVLLF